MGRHPHLRRNQRERTERGETGDGRAGLGLVGRLEVSEMLSRRPQPLDRIRDVDGEVREHQRDPVVPDGLLSD